MTRNSIVLFVVVLFVLGLWSCGSGVQGSPEGTDGDLIGPFWDNDPTDGDRDSDVDGDNDGSVSACEAGLPCLGYPAEVNFGAVVYGESTEKALVLSNPGDIPVNVYGYELCPGEPCPAFSVDPGDDPSAESPLVLEPGESVTWTVRFDRLDASDSQVELRIQSNHLDGREMVKILLIGMEKGQSVFSLSPELLNFEDTSVQEKTWGNFSLVNTPFDSDSKRTAHIVSIGTEAPFYLDQNDPGCYGVMQGANRFLASGATRLCRAFFQPGVGGSFEGELSVTVKKDDAEETYPLTLSGKSIQPFMTLSAGSFCGDNSFGHVTAGYTKSAVFTVANTSPSEEMLTIEAVELVPQEGPFSINYFPFDPDDPNSGEDVFNEPELGIEQEKSWSFEIVFAPTEEGDFSQTLVLHSNAQDYPEGLAEIDLCGRGIGLADSVIGLVLAIPALGSDRPPDEDEDAIPAGDDPVLPVAYAPVWVKGSSEYVTHTDSLGRFTIGIPPEDRPDDVWLVVDGTQAGNGYVFSTKEQYVELSPDAAVETVIILGHYDAGNSQPATADDEDGESWSMDGTASNLDEDMKDVILEYDPAWITPPSGGEREVSIRRASLFELPQPLPEGFGQTADPYHVYRFLPLGLSFSGNFAKLKLPNTSNLPVGSEVGFYMLSGNPSQWTRVSDMRVVDEPLSSTGTVIITPEDGRGITQFGQESGSSTAYDSIGFLGRGLDLENPFQIKGFVKDESGIVIPNAPVQFIGPDCWEVGATDQDGLFAFSLFGVPGQSVLLGSYRDTPYDGTWRSVSAALPVEGHDVSGLVIFMAPEYETGQLQGTATYDTGEPVGAGGMVTVKWINPINADEDQSNDDPALNILLPPAYTTAFGSYILGRVRTTPDSFLEVFVTEPRHHVRSTMKTIIIETGRTGTLDFAVSSTDNVRPYVRNAYPYDGAYDLPLTARLQVTFPSRWIRRR